MTIRGHRAQADRVAYAIIEQKQQEALGRTEPLRVESPAETLRRRLLLDQGLPHSGPASLGVRDLPSSEYWDGKKHLAEAEPSELPWGGPGALHLRLVDALQVAARNSREYQAAKEKVFRTALDLDLERDSFRTSFAGLLSQLFSRDGSARAATNGANSATDGQQSAGTQRSGSSGTGAGGSSPGTTTVIGSRTSAEFSLSRTFKTGATLTARLAVDLVRLLTQDRSSSLGLLADATISIPLLRGSGTRVVTEPLTQAERNVVYAIYEFERFKKAFAVQVASEYLTVLRELQGVTNAEENYKGLITSTRRARRLADAGQIPEFQFDQAVQNELRARDRWVRARQAYASRLDGFKLLLSLPPDAKVELEPKELERLRTTLERLTAGAKAADYTGKVPPADAPVVLREPSTEKAGPLEVDPGTAVKLALDLRLDLRTARGRVEDAQRKVFVAADALGAELTLLGSARVGESRDIATAGQDNARLDASEGSYSALLTLDFPFERTRERNDYRNSLLALEQAARDFQALEDQVKLSVRDKLRDLLEAREALQIQLQAASLAEQRVRSTNLFLQAGRAEIRDLLEAQEALVSAQNAAAAAAVDYRIAELELQRDLGALEVNAEGLWREYSPKGD